MGPVEYLVVAFPGNKFNGEIVPALAELTDKGIIHIIDLVFIRKDADGNVASAELEDLPADVAAAFEGVDGEISDLVNAEDIAFAAEGLDPEQLGRATRVRERMVHEVPRRGRRLRRPAPRPWLHPGGDHQGGAGSRPSRQLRIEQRRDRR